MSDTRQVVYRVLGGLGAGRFSPLLAVQEGPGVLRRRVVLTRPRAEAVYAVEADAPAGVVLPFYSITASEGSFAVWPFVEGAGLPAWASRAGAADVDRIEADLAGSLRALHRSGRAHGAVGLDAVRVTLAGDPVWVGARGGDPIVDEAALATLFEELRALVAAQGEAGSSFDGEALYPNPLSGKMISSATPAPGAPPKARVAAVAALAMTLGAGLGWMYAPRPAIASVQGGAGEPVAVVCEGGKAEGKGAVWIPAGGGLCQVTVTDGAGVVWSAAVMVRAPGDYRCVRRERTLQCFGP